METTQSPDDLCRVDANHPSVGETALDDLQCLLIPGTPKGGDDYCIVGNIKIGVRGRQALVLIYNFLRHWEFYNI